MKKIFSVQALLAFAVIAGLYSCERKYDAPPEKYIPVGDIINIAQLRDSYSSQYGNQSHTFTEGDTTIYCTVVTDEVNGNFYKDVYVYDGTGAILLRMKNSGGLYRGDSIRVNLTGCTLQKYNEMMQIDGVDADANVVKLATGKEVEPLTITLDQLGPLYQARLIRIENVQFASTDTMLTWSDPINLATTNRNIFDCQDNTALIRTSGYSNFAGRSLPDGNGTVIAVVSQFGTTMQLYIRKPEECTLNGPRCQEPYLKKTFEDQDIFSGGWIMRKTVGNVNWEAGSQGSQFGSYYAKISNYIGSANQLCESWYISPALDLSASTTPFLEFKNACNYSGPLLEVVVSNNYDGIGSPTAATWYPLTAVLSSGSWSWVSSGNIDLSSFKVNGVYIAFKYSGTASQGRTWEIDNIVVDEP